MKKWIRMAVCAICPAILGALAYSAGRDDGSYDQYFYDLEHMKENNDSTKEESE